MQIEFSRKHTPMNISVGGNKVGEIYRVATGHFALRLDGIYWDRFGSPNKRGGASAIGFRTLREARGRAVSTLASI